MISYLSDMDGVLIKEGEMIPGADKFLQVLKDNEIRFMVLTNNSMATPRDLSARLRSQGSRRIKSGPPPWQPRSSYPSSPPPAPRT